MIIALYNDDIFAKIAVNDYAISLSTSRSGCLHSSRLRTMNGSVMYSNFIKNIVQFGEIRILIWEDLYGYFKEG